MKTETTYPNFDCLKYKDEVQMQIYEETKDMTLEEWNAYHERKMANDPILSAFEKKLIEAEDRRPIFARPRKAVA